MDFDTRTSISLQRDGNDQPELRFDRSYDQNVERVWEALTDGAQLAVWSPWGAADIDLVPGGRITLMFPGADEGETGEVVTVDRPTTFAFTGHGETLRWELTPHNHGCTMVFTHSVADPAHAPYTAAGYHVCLDQLGAFLTGGAGAFERHLMPPPPDLVAHYVATLPPID